MFDKEKFGTIIKQINDTYPTQYDFADISNVNRTYLSQYINKKLVSPPKPDILKKIASASKGITTYDELMQICGYINIEENDTNQSLDNKLAEKIYNDNIHLLDTFKLTSNDILSLKEILINRNEKDISLEIQLNNYAHTNSTNSKELFSVLIQINNIIKDALINLHKNGILCPIPVYKNDRDLDLFLTSSIVNYTNFNIPVNESQYNYFALLIDNDKMFPLFDVDDVAIICKNGNLENGQIIAGYSITKECCIIGKLFKYDNIIEISYLNAKSDKFMDNDIKFLGKVVKAENKSAFK